MKKLSLVIVALVIGCGLKFYLSVTPIQTAAEPVQVEAEPSEEREAKSELRKSGEDLKHEVLKVQAKIEATKRALAQQAELMVRLKDVDARFKEGRMDANDYAGERKEILQAALDNK